MLKYLLLGSLLYAQAVAPKPLTPEEQLERDRLRALPQQARSMMVSVQARYADGKPARGTINCDGTWCKYDEDEYCAQNLPFKTDSRGVCVFNPTWDVFREDDGTAWMTCHATAGTRSASLTFELLDGSFHVITIPGNSPAVQK